MVEKVVYRVLLDVWEQLGWYRVNRIRGRCGARGTALAAMWQSLVGRLEVVNSQAKLLNVV